MSHVKLVAQREGAVALELLGKLDGRVGGVRPVALPALKAHLRVARAVATVTDHVEHVLLHHTPLQRPPLAQVVVRAVNVQVVIHTDLHCVAFSPQTREKKHKESERKRERKSCGDISFLAIVTKT